MGKGKLAKFADMETYGNVFQYPYSVVSDVPFSMRGHWREEYFKNENPIVLELGCGKGEYTVGLARRHQEMNFIGELMKAVHKEMALIGKPMKAARWGPIGVPILILCYSIG